MVGRRVVGKRGSSPPPPPHHHHNCHHHQHHHHPHHPHHPHHGYQRESNEQASVSRSFPHCFRPTRLFMYLYDFLNSICMIFSILFVYLSKLYLYNHHNDICTISLGVSPAAFLIVFSTGQRQIKPPPVFLAQAAH